MEEIIEYNTEETAKSERIPKLVHDLYEKMPEIETARAVLLTESYRQTENQPMVLRRALAFAHVLENNPIIIRDEELIVGSSTLAPRGCQTYPEFSWEWLNEGSRSFLHIGREQENPPRSQPLVEGQDEQ